MNLMHRSHYILHRVIGDVRRVGAALIRGFLLLFIASFPVYAVSHVMGHGAGDALVWALMFAWVLSVWARRRGGKLPAFFTTPTGRRLGACWAAIGVAVVLAAILNPNA